MEVMLAWYRVEDMEKAKQFYGEVLGLKETFQIQGWAEFSHAEGAASIGLNLNPKEAIGGGAVVALKVADLERTRQELGRHGVQFEGEVEEVGGAVRIGTIRDPFGNRLQLVQVMMTGETA